MKYQFIDDTLKLINFTVTYMSSLGDGDDTIKEYFFIDTYEELEEIISMLDGLNIKYTVEEHNNKSYEWLNNKIFNNSQRKENYIEKAIELGEDEYNKWLLSNDESKKNENAILNLEEKLSNTQFMLADIIALIEL